HHLETENKVQAKTQTHTETKTPTIILSYSVLPFGIDQSTVIENGNNTEMFSAKRDGVYSIIQFVPAADCPTGPGRPIRETSQNDDSDVYHVYCTVPDLPSASTRMM
ncbi:hypothetical protein GOODEAATRI_018806, partial [Goodea atripinnis]